MEHFLSKPTRRQGKQKMSQKGLGPHVRVRLPHPFWAWASLSLFGSWDPPLSLYGPSSVSRTRDQRINLSSLASRARLSHSAIESPYDRTPALCPNTARLRSSSLVVFQKSNCYHLFAFELASDHNPRTK